VIDISNKKILFIAPKFYSYHQEIINFIESKNATVKFFAEDIYTPLYRFSNRIFPLLAKYLKQQYVDKILDDSEKKDYDIVFVIRGGILAPDTMEKLKKNLHNAKFVMYQWDSNQQSNYENIIKYFDCVKTFDKEDAKKYNLEYLPLFYSKQYEDIKLHKKQKKFDIVFFGAYHSDRLEIVKFMDNFCTKNNLKFKYHLYITKMGLFRLIFIGVIKLEDLKLFKTYTVNTSEIIDVYSKSFAVLDIELNIQNGLTMRTFETLGAGLKLITTNKNIQNEPFYNQQNVMIIDRLNYKIDLNFFKIDFFDDEDFAKYSLRSWFNNLFKDLKNNKMGQ